MLRPSKHSHPDKTVLSLALILLKKLKAKRAVEYFALNDYAKKTIKGGEVLFLPALSFLFLLGLVEYLPKTDSIEYTGGNEAK